MSTRTLKAQLSRYLQRAENGEQIVVLRNGRPVAALVPLSQLREPEESARLAEMAARGVVTLPKGVRAPFRGSTVPHRGKLASSMVVDGQR